VQWKSGCAHARGRGRDEICTKWMGGLSSGLSEGWEIDDGALGEERGLGSLGGNARQLFRTTCFCAGAVGSHNSQAIELARALTQPSLRG
jgi:hypothetical protein